MATSPNNKPSTTTGGSGVPSSKPKVKEVLFEWEGKGPGGRFMRAEVRAINLEKAKADLVAKGVTITKIKVKKVPKGSKIKTKEVAVFTRQLSTMLKSGIPMLQAFDVVRRGNPNPAMCGLINQIRTDIQNGESMRQAFERHPKYFDKLFCSLVGAGEAAGILDTLLDRLATYMEKMEAIKSKIKSALMYPIAIMVAAFAVVSVIMIFVIPSFEQIFESFNTKLPLPTLIVMAMSRIFIEFWYLIFGGLGAAIYGGRKIFRSSVMLQRGFDRVLLKLPIFGSLVEKSCLARWMRTLATMFSAGVPLVVALDSVSGAAGNYVYEEATKRVKTAVMSGVPLGAAMMDSGVFPPLALQMTEIGEESGALDVMLTKVSEFYEGEVDDAVAGISSMLEPIIIVILGVIIGGIVVAMYLPIFEMGKNV